MDPSQCPSVMMYPSRFPGGMAHRSLCSGGVSHQRLLDLIQRRDGNEAAEIYITEQLRRRPSVRGLDKLIDVHLSYCAESARENLMILQDLTQKLLENKPIYNCVTCGFKGRSLHWQCPGCKSWHTMKPVHGVEGE